MGKLGPPSLQPALPALPALPGRELYPRPGLGLEVEGALWPLLIKSLRQPSPVEDGHSMGKLLASLGLTVLLREDLLNHTSSKQVGDGML